MTSIREHISLTKFRLVHVHAGPNYQILWKQQTVYQVHLEKMSDAKSNGTEVLVPSLTQYQRRRTFFLRRRAGRAAISAVRPGPLACLKLCDAYTWRSDGRRRRCVRFSGLKFPRSLPVIWVNFVFDEATKGKPCVHAGLSLNHQHKRHIHSAPRTIHRRSLEVEYVRAYIPAPLVYIDGMRMHGTSQYIISHSDALYKQNA
jgi:hypothetical protein